VFKINTSVVFLGNQWVTAAAAGQPRNQDLFFWAKIEFDAESGHPRQVGWSDAMVLDDSGK
jgi:hypothetical protein